MLYWKLIKANIGKRKIFSFAIFLFSLLSIIAASSVINALNNNSNIYDDKYKATKSPDVLLSFNGMRFDEEYINELENIDGVSEIRLIENVLTTMKDKDENDITILIKSEKELNIKLGSIFLSNYFKQNLDYSIGDVVHIKINNISKKFVISGFFEDPIFSSPIMRYNQVIISTTDFEEIINNTSVIESDKNYLIYLSWTGELKSMDSAAVMSEKLAEFSGSLSADFIYDRDYIKTAYTMIPTIVSIILLLATVFIASGLLLVLRYAILTAIEMDYVEIGTLKSLGMKNSQLKLQYIFVNMTYILSGMFLGNILSSLLTKQLNVLYLRLNGLDAKISIDVQSNIPVMFAFTLIALVTILSNLNKLKKISPIQAIGNGKINAAYDKKMFDINAHRWLPFHLRLSLKQYIYKFKNYISLIIITALFSFLLFSTLTLENAFSEKQQVYNILGLPQHDLILVSTSENNVETLKQRMEKSYKVEYFQNFSQSTIQIESQNIIALIYGEISSDMIINNGNLPNNEKEILVTTLLSTKLDKNIGDYVELKSSKGNVEKFKIAGLYQTVNNLGMEIQMLDSGYDLISESSVSSQKAIKFVDIVDLEAIVTQYQENNLDVTVINGRASSDSLIATIQASIRLISIVVLLCTIIMTTFISFLLTLISLKKDDVELVIFRKLGFKRTQLKRQYTLRILFSAMLGTVIGVLMYYCFAQLMFDSILGLVGLTSIIVALPLRKYLFTFLLLLVANIITCNIAMKKNI
jgi:ABC-type transport system, involved in lipoprotein release, permease component